MKIFMLVIFTIYCFALTNCDDEYDTKYDNMNLDEVLGNNRLLTNYIKCLMNEGPCTPDGTVLKTNLPDAIETGCAKCSEKQRDGSEQVIRYIIENRPDDWKRIETIYDKEGTYRDAYLKEKQRVADAKSNLTSSEKL